MKCKCHSPELWKGPASDIFVEFQALEYYDGPVTAVCKCIDCNSAKLLSIIAWEPSLSAVRVFGLTDITSEQFRGVVSQFLILERKAVACKSDPDNDYENELLKLLREARAPEVVMAYDYLKEVIVAARHYSGEGILFEDSPTRVSKESFLKWISYLGLKVKGS